MTLLFVDSGYGIHALFPLKGAQGDNRLAGGASFTTPRVQVTADTVGVEQVVVIAVCSPRDRVDFSCLEQSTLQRVRSMPESATAMESPLGRLLQGAMYGSDATRGLAAVQLDDFAVRLLSWVTVPAGGPQPK